MNLLGHGPELRVGSINLLRHGPELGVGIESGQHEVARTWARTKDRLYVTCDNKIFNKEPIVHV